MKMNQPNRKTQARPNHDVLLAGRGLATLIVLSWVAACAQRSTQFFVPSAQGSAGSGGGFTILLDAQGNPGEAGGAIDALPTCSGNTEICNGLDDDCDGVIDNGFDLQNDPENCGACGTLCSFPRATAACVQGTCVIASCNPGYVDADKQMGNGCECLKTNGGKELCDGADNDCDGVIDNGFDLQTDPTNCGACGVACSGANATGSCQNGKCSYTCQPGFYDIDKKANDGCEYACTPTADPTEICDGLDNDCNGLRDDADPNMVYTPTDRTCKSDVAGACQTGISTCIAGKLVCVGAGQASEEVCDGRDNNCDGRIDESDPNLGKACYAAGTPGCNAVTGVCQGLCSMGAYTCTSGKLLCSGMVAPQVEICDGKDNDCDGIVDNGFNTDTDPNNCGGCGHVCSFPQAVAACQKGVCVLDPGNRLGACAVGWVDANHNIADGCEYQCTPSGSEVCDGKDNDCNGLIDEKDPALLYPSNFCSQIGECGKGPGGSKHAGWEGAATFPVCTNATGAPVSASPTWLCNYPSTVQLSAPNEIVGQETWCDGLDNDCNGVIDDPYVGTLGTLCSDASSTAVGACRRQGTMRCQTDKSQAPACDFTGVPPTPDPTNEICDGIDNDCDGLVDESWDNPQGLALCNGKDCLGVRDAVVAVNAASAPGGSYYIYKYEASRSDANATSPGVSTTRACSRAVTAAATPVLPWSSTTWNQADAACKAAGMRLCRVTRTGSQIMTDEWGFACRAGQTCTGDTFPYSCTYDAKACNGLDSNLGTALACGANPACSTTGDLDTTSSNDAIFDMSGNLAEWTDDRRDILDTTGSPAGSGSASAIYTMRGGAFDSFFRGMACDFMGTQLHPSFSQPDTGFRCCSSCPPGQADCSGSCRNLATDTANCGSCALACKAGTSCQNGTCK